MKHRHFLKGISGLVLVFSLAFIGCSDDGGKTTDTSEISFALETEALYASDTSTAVGTTIGEFSITGSGSGGDYEFALGSGGDNDSFEIDNKTELKVKTALTVAKTYSLTVTAASYTGTVEIVVKALPSDFTATKIDAKYLLESNTHVEPGETVATFGTPVGGYGPYTYELATGDGTNDADNTSFSVSGTELKVKTTALGTAQTYKAYVKMADKNGKAIFKALTVAVAAVKGITGAYTTATLSAGTGISAGDDAATITTPFSGGVGSYTYAITGGTNAALFNIDAAGKVTFKAAYSTQGALAVDVTVTDDDGNFVTENVTVTVNA